jgi:adenylylsulfate kinase-like enzyme
MQKKLILISGSPCVGKTAVGTMLFESYYKSAYLDGDWCCKRVQQDLFIS